MAGLMELMQRRQSDRGPFDTNHPIEPDHLKMILEAARWAPTPHNMQNFEILIVDDPTRLQALQKLRSDAAEEFLRESYAQLSFSEDELSIKRTGLLASNYPEAWTNPEAWRPDSDYRSQLAFVRNWMRDTTLLLIVFSDKRKRAPGSENDILGHVGLGCVMQNMWLMSTHLGLSFQVLSALSNEQVECQLKSLFELPEWAQIGFACRVGYLAEPTGHWLRVRRDLKSFCHHNRFGDLSFSSAEYADKSGDHAAVISSS